MQDCDSVLLINCFPLEKKTLTRFVADRLRAPVNIALSCEIFIIKLNFQLSKTKTKQNCRLQQILIVKDVFFSLRHSVNIKNRKQISVDTKHS